MELDFNNEGPKAYSEYESKYLELAGHTFNLLNVSKNFVIDVTITDNNKIHEINKQYRKIDRPTDVISFAFLDDENEGKLVGNAPVPLGEIIISYEKAEEQAKEYGHSVNREMCFLFVHGILHLLGYDHMTPEDEKEMFDLQDKILGGI